MLSFHKKPVIAGAWNLGVRATFSLNGTEVKAYAVLPPEICPVTVRVIDMGQFPLSSWREGEFTLTEEVVAWLHATLASYPELLPPDRGLVFDGIAVLLGVERVGVQPSDNRLFRFRMGSRACHTDPATQVAWDLLDPWREDSLGK